MNQILAAALELQEFLQERNWRFCIIGGLAVARWGQPRATQDVDLSLFAGLGSEEQYVDPLLERFRARVTNARDFALASRVVLLDASNGVPLDIALAAYDFEERVIARASPFQFAAGLELVTASLEDVLVLKAFADRPQDWADVEGIAVRQAGCIDWDYVETELGPLCELKETREPLARLQEIQARLGH
ncbi:MAG: DUF6036 family nucleotidyltransferase [Pirellulales bacterium]